MFGITYKTYEEAYNILLKECLEDQKPHYEGYIRVYTSCDRLTLENDHGVYCNKYDSTYKSEDKNNDPSIVNENNITFPQLDLEESSLFEGNNKIDKEFIKLANGYVSTTNKMIDLMKERSPSYIDIILDGINEHIKKEMKAMLGERYEE